MPTLCSCNDNFTLAHALNCQKGEYTHMRHNELRYFVANLFFDECHDDKIEPLLQPLQEETFALKTMTTDDAARLHIKANGL